MAALPVRLIVGLGNPGPNYKNTRHNLGFFFVDQLAQHHQLTFKLEKKLKAFVASAHIAGQTVLIAKPDTFMNLSGEAVQKLCHFYKITPDALLVAHDELDLPPGQAKWKYGGGHGGHNGLRDIAQKLSSTDFYRLRLGIGHPGQASAVSNYVLSAPSKAEIACYEAMLKRAEDSLPQILAGDLAAAMNALNGH